MYIFSMIAFWIVFLLPVICNGVPSVEIFRGEISVSSSSQWTTTYKFAKGDSIIVEAKTVKGKDISYFELAHWNGSPVLTYRARKSIEARYWTPTLAYLTILFKNTAILDNKVYEIVIKRVPMSDSLVNFETKFEVEVVYDTVFESREIFDTLYDTSTVWLVEPGTQRNVYSQIGEDLGRGSTSGMVEFDVPPASTGKVSYWIEVEGAKPIINKEEGQALTSTVGAIDPAIGLLTGIITFVASTKSAYTINYWLTNSIGTTMASGLSVACEGKVITLSPGKYYIRFINTSATRGGPVFVKVATLCRTAREVTRRTVQVPIVTKRLIPK